jgi:hypothetical protein
MANDENQFTDTATGWAQRLTREFDAARKVLKPWHEQADRALSEYLDERPPEQEGRTKWNIFTADTQTKEAMLYGNPPKCNVSRRFADAADDQGRVAGEILERLLNEDIEGKDDSLSQAVEYLNSDNEKVSFGLARIRYVMGETVEKPGQPAIPGPPDPMTGMPTVRAPEVPAQTLRPNEQVETDYVHFKDFLYSPARVWHEVGWIAFRAQMAWKEKVEKFGEEVAEALPCNSKKGGTSATSQDKEGKNADPWERTDVWEVWVKDGKRVFFFVEGYPSVLAPVGVEVQEVNNAVVDPLGLENFWPCPRPIIRNCTTSKLVPKPDREFAKDLYDEVNELSGRIKLLESAVRVVGVYDANNGALKQLLDQGRGNEMLPVANWAVFGEKGGLAGAVEFFPVEQVVGALMQLRESRTIAVDEARQITGMADIMRGVGGDGATATEQRIKARFGSVRLEKRQKELARFVTDLQRLRAEVITKHFDESTILQRCNCQYTPDAQVAPQAVKLIKSEFLKYRIEVKPETLSMTDFDALRQESTEVISSIAMYLQSVGPLVQQMPAAMPFMLQILQWFVSKLRGSAEIEGVLDQAIKMTQQMASQPKPQQPDPKLLQIQAKSQADLQKEQFKHQADIERIGVEVQADAQREQAQAQWNTREAAAKAEINAASRPPPGGFR